MPFSRIKKDGSVSMRKSGPLTRLQELRGTFQSDAHRAGMDDTRIKKTLASMQALADKGDLKGARKLMRTALAAVPDDKVTNNYRKGRLSAAGRARAMTARERAAGTKLVPRKR